MTTRWSKRSAPVSYIQMTFFCVYIPHPVTSKKTSALHNMQPNKDKYTPANSSNPPLKWCHAFRPDPSLLASPLRHSAPLTVCDSSLGGEKNTPVSTDTPSVKPLVFFFLLHTSFCFWHCSLARVFQPLRQKEMSFFQLPFDLSLYLLDCLFWLWAF